MSYLLQIKLFHIKFGAKFLYNTCSHKRQTGSDSDVVRVKTTFII